MGYRFESPKVVDSMLDELESTPGALPLLQFTASHLWEDRDRGRKLLTEDSYRAMGGIAGTLARHADEVLAGMPASQVRLARAIFERLVTPERTRAIAGMSELLALPGDAADIEDVLQTLADARLLIIESSGIRNVSLAARGDKIDSGAVEIVHESLIERWPTLRRWLDENQDDAEFRARLRGAAEQWHKSGKDRGVLWRGRVAREAEIWRERYPKRELPERERDYLAAVLALGQRAARIRRMAIIGTIGALVAIVIAGSIALVAIRQAEQRASQRADELREKSQELTRALSEAEKQKQRAIAGEKRAKVKEAEARESARLARAKELEAQKSARLAREKQQEADQSAQQARAAAVAEAAAAERARVEGQRAKRAEGAALQAKEAAVKAKNDEATQRRIVEDLKEQAEARANQLEKQLRGGMIDDIPEEDDE